MLYKCKPIYQKTSLVPTLSALNIHHFVKSVYFFKIKQHKQIFPTSQHTSSFATGMHLHSDILTLHILHDHAEVPTGFEGTEHGDNKGVLCEGEDVSFHEGLLDLVPQDQVLLINLLHGKSLASLKVTHQVHSAGTNADTHTWPHYFFCLNYLFTACKNHLWPCLTYRSKNSAYLGQWSKQDVLKLYSPIRSITDQLDGLEVCFSWWLHCSNLTLWIKDHNVLIKYDAVWNRINLHDCLPTNTVSY